MSQSDTPESLSGWRKEKNLFLLALGFFSRLPMGSSVQYSPENMHQATRYFPMIGWLLAAILICLFQLLNSLLPVSVVVMLLLVASVLLTGALHEDGLADTCDGFWGGMTPERKIDIMKDSRIGTYGACGLLLALGLKYQLLLALAEHDVLILALCIAYPLSRALALSHVQDLPYVSDKGTVKKNKSDPLARPVSQLHLVVVLVSGAAGMLLLPFTTMILLAVTCAVWRALLKHWMQRHIGGFTGDVLGAAQQLQELMIYLVLVASIGGIA